MEQKSEIVLYQPEGAVSLEVRLENETVWLNRQQIAELFDRDIKTIGKHINNALREELTDISVVAKFATTATDGKVYQMEYYNLDMVLSIGYRVKSKRGVEFRQWANKVLKEYMLKGYSINQKLDSLEKRIDNRLREHDSEIQRLSNQVDFFVRHSLPPIEGIFFAGQIFDNYIDESVLTLFGKRGKSVSVVIYTDKIIPQLELDIKRFNAQYSPVKVKLYTKAHDRFLIIDGEIYHIGASLKDLGKKLFAFSKISAIPPEIIYKQIDS